MIGLVISAVELLRARLRGLLLPAAYCLSALVVARDSRNQLPRKTDRYRLMAVFATMHVAWGTGFLFGRRRQSRVVSVVPPASSTLAR